MLINCSTQVSTKKSLSRDIIMLINSRPNIAYLNHLGLRHALSVDSLSEDLASVDVQYLNPQKSVLTLSHIILPHPVT